MPSQENNGLQLNLNDSYYHPQYPEQGHPTDHSQYPFPVQQQLNDIQTKFPSGNQTADMTSSNKRHHRPSAQYRIERERVLSNTPVETLIQRLIQQEYEAKEGRRLLRTAITKLEALQQRAQSAEQAYRELESGQTTRGLKTAKNIMSAQEETAKAKYDAGLYRLYLEQAQREVQEKQEALKSVQSQRDTAEKLANKARDLVRQLNDERLVATAREEGRRVGYNEGMKRGRTLGVTGQQRHRILDRLHQTPIGSGAAFIEEYDEGEGNDSGLEGGRSRRNRTTMTSDPFPRGRGRSAVNTPRSQPLNASSLPTRTATPADHAVPSSNAIRQELEAVKETFEEKVKLEAEQKEKVQRELRESERLRQLELERVRDREAELEREKEELRALAAKQEKEREEDMRLQREAEAARQKEMIAVIEKEKEKEKALERERDDERRKREEKDRDLESERMKVRELEFIARVRERERDRDGSSSSSQRAASVRSPGRLPYLRMPQPPPPPIMVESASEPPPTNGTETPPLRVPPPRLKGAVPPPIRVPTHPQQQTQPYPYPRGIHRRTHSSPDTTSSTMSNFDIITFPSGTTARGSAAEGSGGNNRWPRTDLSDIPEVPSVRSHSRNSDDTSPAWLNNPPPILTERKSGPDIERWRRTASGGYAPDSGSTDHNYLSPSFQPHGRTAERTSHGPHSRGSSGSSINITIESPSRPPSSIGAEGQEAAGFLSPNHPPLALVPEEPSPEPPVIPVIPSMGHHDLTNFPPAGFVPFKNPTNGTDSSSSSRQSLPSKGARLGSSIYSSFAAPGGANANDGSYQQRPPSRTGTSIYANTAPSLPQGPQQPNNNTSYTPRHAPHQIYGRPPSSSGSQPMSRPQIYAPTGSSSATAEQTPKQTARQIYAAAPTPPSLSGNTRPLQNDPSHIYGPPKRGGVGDSAGAAGPRGNQIYAPTSLSHGQSQMSHGGGPVIPHPPGNQIYAPTPPGPASLSLGPTRSGPVIPPPPPGSIPSGIRGNPYLNNNGTPQPFIPPLPTPGVGVGVAGSSGAVTPRARFANLREDEDDEDDGIDHDEETRRNTEVNRVYGGSPHVMGMQMPLPIPPPGAMR